MPFWLSFFQRWNEYPFFSALFYQQDEDDDNEHVPSTDSEYPQRSKLPKITQPSLITSQQPNNSSSLLLPPPPSSSSSRPNPETEHMKASIKTEEPLPVICEICAETRRTTQMIKNKTCHHSYCSDCVTKLFLSWKLVGHGFPRTYLKGGIKLCVKLCFCKYPSFIVRLRIVQR